MAGADRVAVVLIGGKPVGLALLVDDRTAVGPVGLAIGRRAMAVTVEAGGARRDIGSQVTTADVLCALHVVQPVGGLVPLAAGAPVRAGDPVIVWSIGATGGPLAVEGRVRASGPGGAGDVDRVVPVDVPAGRTMLGSPVFTEHGLVVGVIVGQEDGRLHMTRPGQLDEALRRTARRF